MKNILPIIVWFLVLIQLGCAGTETEGDTPKNDRENTEVDARLSQLSRQIEDNPENIDLLIERSRLYFEIGDEEKAFFPIATGRAKHLG